MKTSYTEKELSRVTLGKWCDLYEEYKKIYNMEARKSLFKAVEKEVSLMELYPLRWYNIKKYRVDAVTLEGKPMKKLMQVLGIPWDIYCLCCETHPFRTFMFAILLEFLIMSALKLGSILLGIWIIAELVFSLIRLACVLVLGRIEVKNKYDMSLRELLAIYFDIDGSKVSRTGLEVRKVEVETVKKAARVAKPVVDFLGQIYEAHPYRVFGCLLLLGYLPFFGFEVVALLFCIGLIGDLCIVFIRCLFKILA